MLAIGCCLATREDLSAARADAERGAWAAAMRLPGSCLTVVRDRAGLRIAGDRAGTVTVYWIPVREGVLWATAAAPPAAFAETEPNPAVLLSAFMVRGVDVLAADSHFHTVRRVPPGHVLILAPGWQPRTEAVPALTAKTSFEEGATAVRETVTAAVSRRAARSGPISSDLSGGVDSGTVTRLAAACGPLLAVTYTDARMGEQDDMRHAERIARDHPQITHTKIHGTRAGTQHFDGLEDPAVLPFTDTPSFTLGLLAIKAAQLAPATAHGSRAHLTGRGGDDVLDAVPTMVIDQYRAGAPHGGPAPHRGVRPHTPRRTVAGARAGRPYRAPPTLRPSPPWQRRSKPATSTSSSEPPARRLRRCSPGAGATPPPPGSPAPAGPRSPTWSPPAPTPPARIPLPARSMSGSPWN
ncbi:asparagine synthase-related protein [Streptomyces sp. NPDC052811]|uniref:asparagine synthase-related protein n=1 Tax=Streptomyces sp. NPDC052811 TaxID=3155731 RepID=UPI00341746F9